MTRVVTANQTAYNTNAEAAGNGITAASNKWFALQHNTLDGSFHPIPDDPLSQQVGWWGTSISNGSGVLSEPSILTIDETRTVWSIQVFGDALLDEYPVDFSVQLFNGQALLHTHQVTGNTQVHYLGQLPQAYAVTRMVFTFTRVNKPGRTIRIHDVLSNFEILRGDVLRVRTSGSVATMGIGLSAFDTLRLKTTPGKAVTASLNSADSVPVGVGELVSVSATLQAVDNLLLRLAETAVADNQLSSSDVLHTRLSEAVSITNLLSSTDTLTQLISESSQMSNLLSSADTLLSKLSEVMATEVSFGSSDSIQVTTSPGGNISAGVFSGDTLNVSPTPATVITNNLAATDILSMLTSYTTAVSALIASNDALKSKLDDSSFFTQYEIWKEDVLRARVDESRTVEASLASSDNLNIGLVEANQIVVMFSGQDVLKVSSGLAEERQVTASFTRPDQLVVTVSELNTITNSFTAVDNIVISLAGQRNITNTFTATDTLRTATSESRHVTNRLQSQDGITLRSDMTDEVTFELGRNGVIKVSLKERSYMENIYTAMDADTRQVFGKVEITYTDVFSDESIASEASETGRYTYPEQLADNVTVSAHKWFSLHDNKLDGSFHPLPSEQEYSVGWWSASLSDANGNMSTKPKIAVTFQERPVTKLRLCGSSMLNCYPADFTFTLYGVEGNVLYTHNVTNNKEIDWKQDIEPVINVARIEATIHKINRPFSAAKITEMYTAVVEMYDEDDIESINILEETGYVTGGLPIGNISANEVDIVLQNTNRKFDLHNVHSSLHGLVKRNRRVKVWMGAKIGQEIEWHPMGTYWTALWDIPRHALVATLTARDRLDLLRVTDFTTSKVYRDKSLYDLFEIVLLDAGLREEDFALDPDLKAVIIPHTWFDRMSHRAALQRLAGAGVIQIYCTKEGKVKVNIDLDATEGVMATFDDDTNVYHSKYPLAVGEQVNYVEVTSKRWVLGDLQTLYESEDATTLEPYEETTQTYKFRQLPVVEADMPVMQASPGVELVDYQLYAWGMEVTYRNTSDTQAQIDGLLVRGRVLEDVGRQALVAKDEQSIRDDGKITVNIEHDFIQTPQYAQTLANRILETYKVGRYDVMLDNRGNVALRLGDRVNVVDSYTGQVDPYMVSRQQIQWAGYLSAVTEAKKL